MSRIDPHELDIKQEILYTQIKVTLELVSAEHVSVADTYAVGPEAG